MCVLNGIDRFSPVGEVIDRVPRSACGICQASHPRRAHRSRQYITTHGEDDLAMQASAAGQLSTTEGDNV
jgi:phosphoketolase